MSFPADIEELIALRHTHRANKQFEASDTIRTQLESSGYTVTDYPDTFTVEKIEAPVGSSKTSMLVLFGSGEISPTGRSIHAAAFEAIGKKKNTVVILSTPAGFQPNVETVCEEIRDFFLHFLSMYIDSVEIVYANTQGECNDASVIAPIQTADYIFMGPGSPTYAVKTLYNSLLLESMLQRVKEGASLSLSSAAVVAASHMALPVYEIFKVGEPLHWVDGLNLYEALYEPLTVVPHCNNQEGMPKLDTSHCYMGAARFEKLHALLPVGEHVWGLDEQTGVLIDLHTKDVRVLGKGKRTDLSK